MPNHLPYDPGVLPTKPAPQVGESITIEVEGLPPCKDEHFSIRNRNHPRHADFMTLRRKAIEAMGGRAWSFTAVGLDLILYAPELPQGRRLMDYMAGVEDTLDGSSGYTFTFLPIAFEDNCQVCHHTMKFVVSAETRYTVTVRFLE